MFALFKSILSSHLGRLSLSIFLSSPIWLGITGNIGFVSAYPPDKSTIPFWYLAAVSNGFAHERVSEFLGYGLLISWGACISFSMIELIPTLRKRWIIHSERQVAKYELLDYVVSIYTVVLVIAYFAPALK